MILPDFPQIRPPLQQDKQSAQGVSNLQYQNILPQSFVFLILGRPGCGQSHLLTELITNQDFYKQKFHKVIIISPSRISAQIDVQDDPFYSQDLSDDHISFVIDTLNKKTAQSSGRMFNFLFVFDDCVAKLQHLAKGSVVTNLFFNRRHIIKNANVSIIITSQEFKSIAPKIRAVVTGLYLFTPSPRDLDIVRAQFTVDADLIRQLLYIMKMYLDNTQHQFMFIQLLPQLELYYNFLKVY